MTRTPAIHHCTPTPTRFFGRAAELALLDHALAGGQPSVVAMTGPGGQGKTAIVQHWLANVVGSLREPDSGASGPPTSNAVFFWSFYRGKDSDQCLREMLAYAEGLDAPPDVSASWCVDRLVKNMRQERWALVLDGTEVVQHEQGAWHGRFVHPELGRLLEELASAPMPGVAVVTSRFALPTLANRPHFHEISLTKLESASAIALLRNQGVQGSGEVLERSAAACGFHAKAVELFGEFVTYFHQGTLPDVATLPPLADDASSTEEAHVSRILTALQSRMPPELQDILALSTSFRQPVTETRLCDYLRSEPVRKLLHESWGRSYEPFSTRPLEWLLRQIEDLITLRLLERVHVGRSDRTDAEALVLDAHPLVRRGFEHLLGPPRHAARSRAGFLRGRPDRRPPQTLEEAREEVELFHAYADAELWNEADSTFVALDNPKHRFLAPAFERDLLLRFFPQGDWRQPPLWAGFGRYRSLAICFEMLGQFADAMDAYRPADAALRGDALIALGHLQPFVEAPQAAHPWQTLWQAYRAHAFALLGRREEALRLALSIVPTDVYEWVHVFECLLRLGRLDALDMRSVLYRPPFGDEHRWSQLARERMRLDHARILGEAIDLGRGYRDLLDAYDRGGLPFERVLTRLSYARWLLAQADCAHAQAIQQSALELCKRFGMARLERDCTEIGGVHSRP